MMLHERTLCFAADGAAGAAAAPATEAPAPALAPAPVAPVAPATEAPALKDGDDTARVVPPADNRDLQDLIAAHARSEMLAAELKALQEARAAESARLDTYRVYALKAAQKALESAPEFVRSRVQIDEADPLRTIGEVESLLAIYEEAVKAAKAGGTAGSAPPPSVGTVSQRPKSVWEPVGPMPRKR